MEGLEVDLKGAAQVVGYLPGLDLKGAVIGQISGECQSDLKGESEKGTGKTFILDGWWSSKMVKTRGSYNSSPY